MSNTSYRHDVLPYQMYMSFVAIGIGTIAYFGTVEPMGDWFEKGRFVTNTEGWEYRYNGVTWHYGMMVSNSAKIAVVSTVGILFSLMAHVWVMECPKLKVYIK